MTKRLVTLATIVALAAACGGSTATPDEPTTANPPTTTTTARPAPPCFGLEETSTLPDWFRGGLALGESHVVSGGVVDFTGYTGCAVDGGVTTVLGEVDDPDDRRLGTVYVEDCDDFELIELPDELRLSPPSDSWVCISPDGEGGLLFVQRQG